MLLKNCLILEGELLVKKDILIEKGKIKKIASIIEGSDYVDINGKIAIPGVIDPHVHFREPGMTQKEDFFTGSCAAAAGGVTTILDMPNAKPPATTAKELENKRELAKKSIVNYGFHFGATADNIKEIEKAKNIASVKVFMDATTGNLLIEDEKILSEIFRTAKTIAVHAEGKNVEKAMKLRKNRLYLCHITTKDEIDLIRKKKTENVFVEVTPHHLFLTKKDESYLIKMKPSLKSKQDQDALWNAISDGIVDTIGSDHAPHLITEKRESDLYGVPGVETSLPLMLDAVNARKITLKKVVQLMCENPAKIFQTKNKGYIKEGFDADLTIVDMDLLKKVTTLYTKCGWSPFHYRRLRGWPIMTIVNGNIVFEDGKLNTAKNGQEVLFHN